MSKIKITGSPANYGEILARNIRAARARIGIGQENVAVRMRALGYDAWVRQTVSKSERGDRRMMAEEVFALAYVLQTTIAALMAPGADDQAVVLPSGATIDAGDVYRSAVGTNMMTIWWDGDKPMWSDVERRAWNGVTTKETAALIQQLRRPAP
ncbi:MAG TPA: hypothetical protein VMU52_05920 [Steroidobacteraceae bacterium]|nr:hypothetical protein [Steroidobacteraceae bacterium]